MHVVVATIVHHPEDARIFHRQIPALLAAGHRVTYVAPAFDTERELPGGLAHVPVPRASGRRRITALREARRQLQAMEGVDLTIVHDPELLLLAGSIDRPRVWDVHEDLPAQIADKPWIPSSLRPLARGPARLLERLGAARFSLVLAEQAYTERFGEHPIVPNTPRVPDTVTAPGTDRVVYVGRVSRSRGLSEMVELSGRLRDGVHLHLMGPVDHSVPTSLVPSSGPMTIHGFVPNDVALPRMEGALAGLSLLHDLPNYRHSLPTKVLEYMARGVPVITTPLPEARRIVEAHDCGIVVGFDDVAGVADAIARLRDDRGLRERLASNGRQAARDRFNWAVDAQRFVAVCENLATA